MKTEPENEATAEIHLKKRLSFIKSLYKKLPIKADTLKKHRRFFDRFVPTLLTVKNFALPPVPSLQTFFAAREDHFGNAKSIKISSSDEPLVSIIIPIYGQIGYTLDCLASIAAYAPRFPIEVIVIDDCSPDESFEILRNVSGIRLHRNETNQGFIRSCNRAAAAACGKYLYFLNNDTQVTPGWLDELARTFHEFPGTGLAGSKLVYSNGQLQEAGSLIFQNGGAWNYGRLGDPATPIYSYAREVDYCSGASILIPKEVFDELGQFDELYLPAYCEDSDLALKVRAAGYRVIYQPLSTVIHFEGITSGKDVSQGAKRYQVENLKKLYARWKDFLREYQPFGVDIDNAKDRRAKKRVLLVEHCTPTPDKDAGSVTIFNLMLLLRESDFQVTFVPEDNFLYVPEYSQMLQRVGIEVLYGPFEISLRRHLKKIGSRYDLVVLSRPHVVDRHIKDVRRFCRKAKVLYYTHDLHFLRLSREAEVLRDAAKFQAAEEIKRLEFAAVRATDATVLVSESELKAVENELPTDKLHVLPLIQGVPGTDKSFSERRDLVFIGNFLHTPNADAVKFFVAEVFPRLRESLPGVRFYIVGDNATDEIKSLSADDVILMNFVKDLNLFLDKMRVSVAPLRYGAGVKGKIITAMAVGLPVVATSIAAEGMSLTDGKTALLADDPQPIAEAITKLYRNESLWNKISREAIDFARLTWGTESVWKDLSKLLSELGIEIRPHSYPLSEYSEYHESDFGDMDREITDNQ